MKNFVKVLAAMLLGMLTMGCVREMDPFSGDVGIRMNVNGRRCISFDSETNAYLEFYHEEGNGAYSFSKTMYMQLSGAGLYTFTLSASSPARMTTGVPYECSATLDIDTEHVPLTGEVTFLSLGDDDSYVEAEFALSGRHEGKEYVVKHGFLRLQRGAWR